MPAGISLSDFYYILPELVLTGGALVVLIADVLLPRGSNKALAWVTLLAIAWLPPMGRARADTRGPLQPDTLSSASGED